MTLAKIKLLLILNIFYVYCKKAPNFILIYADDFGYGDLQCYGNPTQERGAIDDLASEGMRFTQWYSSSAVCTPSRAALLTGKLPVRLGMYGRTKPVFLPADSGGLPKSETTIAEALQKLGYKTGFVGKWHLGINEKIANDGNHLPNHHGFQFVGYNLPFTHDFVCNPKKFTNEQMKDICFLSYNDTIIEQPYDPTKLAELFVESSKEFITQSHFNNSNPFFLYYSLSHVHSYITPSKRFQKSSKRGAYGDSINEMSWSVGQIVDKVKELNIHKNTLVLFISDHGPQIELCGHGGSTGGLKGSKLTTWEGGVRVPAIAWWPGTIVPGQVNSDVISTLDVYNTLLDLAGNESEEILNDGRSLKDVLLDGKTQFEDRILFFYFNDLLTAMRVGKYKIHFYSRKISFRSIHTNCDKKLIPFNNRMSNIDTKTLTFHDPFLIYDLDVDPGELYPLHHRHLRGLVIRVKQLVKDHQKNLQIPPPLFDTFDKKLRPCCNPPDCICQSKYHDEL